MISKFPGKWDGMAAVLGMTKDALSNRVYERRNQSVSVEDALQMQEFSGMTLFAEAVATQSGGVFTKLVEPGAISHENLHSKFQELWATLGTLSRAFTEYTDDNHIDKIERAELERISNEIHKTMRELMALMFQIYCKPDSASEAGQA
jgi:hypothetical protein